MAVTRPVRRVGPPVDSHTAGLSHAGGPHREFIPVNNELTILPKKIEES